MSDTPSGFGAEAVREAQVSGRRVYLFRRKRALPVTTTKRSVGLVATDQHLGAILLGLAVLTHAHNHGRLAATVAY